VLDAARRPVLGRVINATGIVLHTNLGRAPLAAAAVAAVAEVAGSYSNLEFDLTTGERGSRTQGVEPLLRQITGAESALAVNNNAAAVLLALSGLAGGGEVVVSRGELVEIGGGFRIPDVIQQGGARLVEVGTTNKTRIADYAGAITPATRVLLKVHQSNFRVSGFTEETKLPELAALAQARGLLVVHDLGSGTLVDLAGYGLPPEMTVQASIAAGVDVVAFSGDKLLGGPQSGLLAGRAAAIDRLRRHPLLRALRLDKLTLAALEATLRLHCHGTPNAVPVLRKMSQAPAELRARAERLVHKLGPLAAGWCCAIVPTTGFAGGGTLPDAGIPSIGLSLRSEHCEPERLKSLLRAGDPPVVGRIADGVVLLDMLTVDDDELAPLANTMRAAMST
jgi:L-seryl-tRNA(Ser) seleniumtransferase